MPKHKFVLHFLLPVFPQRALIDGQAEEWCRASLTTNYVKICCSAALPNALHIRIRERLIGSELGYR